MFNCNESPRQSLAPDKLAQLTDEQLYLLFSVDNFAKMDKKSRLAALQEVENRRAKLDGREPVLVKEGKGGDFDNPHLRGQHVYSPMDGKEVIYVSWLFLEENSPHHLPAGAFETVVHEGRHSYQHYIKNNHPDQVPRKVLDEWRSSDVKYFPGSREGDPEDKQLIDDLKYYIQSIEIDARREARSEMIRARDAMAAQGVDTRDIEAQIYHSYKLEVGIIRALQDVFTEDMIDALEKEVLDAMRDAFPGEDFGQLKLFDHARLILQAPRIQGFDDDAVMLVDILDLYENLKLAGIDETNFNKLNEYAHEKLQERTDAVPEKIAADRIQSSI